ncbi:MAG: molybdopterin-binding protein [Fervidicoccaceae archaeon]
MKVEEAVGKKLALDTTYVGTEGAFTLLPRGHIIKEDDVEKLKSSGAYFVWVEDGSEDVVHEQEATAMVAEKIIGENLKIEMGRQGATLIYSAIPGIFMADRRGVAEFNKNGNIIVITVQDGKAVGKEEIVAVVDAIPPFVSREVLNSLNFSKLLSVKGFSRRKVSAVITGTEIYEGRKRDLYAPILREKCEKYGWELLSVEIVPDNEEAIKGALNRAERNGAEGVIVTGGLSVDPTDRTLEAIKAWGAKIMAYGLPIKPTTMSAIAYKGDVPVLAISAGGIYYRDFNAIDIFFTKMMAGIVMDEDAIFSHSVGGLLPNFNPHMKKSVLAGEIKMKR